MDFRWHNFSRRILPARTGFGGNSLDHHTSSVIEGFSGITFIVFGLLALWNHGYFLAPCLAQEI
ncbi:MAG: hypothetical protein R3E08_09390 [Thiotrichaceae bacterium]